MILNRNHIKRKRTQKQKQNQSKNKNKNRQTKKQTHQQTNKHLKSNFLILKTLILNKLAKHFHNRFSLLEMRIDNSGPIGYDNLKNLYMMQNIEGVTLLKLHLSHFNHHDNSQ